MGLSVVQRLQVAVVLLAIKLVIIQASTPGEELNIECMKASAVVSWPYSTYALTQSLKSQFCT